MFANIKQKKQLKSASRKFNVTGEKITKAVIFTVLAVYAVSLLYPFLWMFYNSFKDIGDWRVNVNGLPTKWIFANYSQNLFTYKSAISGFNIPQMFLLSIGLTLAGTFLTVFFSTSAAYVVSKYDFWGKKLLYSIAVFVIVVPIVGTLPAKLQIMQSLGLYDNLVGMLFLYSSAFGMNFILLHGYFANISWSYAEAAFIDGASDVDVFFRIMLPMGKGAVIAVAILQSIGIWNDYSTPLLFLPSMTTLAVGLDELQKSAIGTADYPTLFAAITVAVLPVITLFIAFQKTIIANTVAGGLKG